QFLAHSRRRGTSASWTCAPTTCTLFLMSCRPSRVWRSLTCAGTRSTPCRPGSTRSSPAAAPFFIEFSFGKVHRSKNRLNSTAGVRHRQRSVACPNQPGRVVHNFLQHGLEAQLARDVQASFVQRKQLAVL